MCRCAGRGMGSLVPHCSFAYLRICAPDKKSQPNNNLPLVGFLHRNKYEQKTSEQKLSSTMAEPFAGSSGTAIATYTKPSR